MADFGESIAGITFVLPYYNEAGFVGRTIASLESQIDRRFGLVLVDNGSTDRGPIEAKAAADRLTGTEIRFLIEKTPGKIFALRTGCRDINTLLVGTLDADTIYPPDYVSHILALFDGNPDASCVMAFGLSERGPRLRRFLQLAKFRLFAFLLSGKCHTGGFGQAFRRELLQDAGGFDVALWPYVLEDHEIVHRLGKLGRIAYAGNHVCFPSDRRADRSNCSWNLFERVLYKLLPASMMDWFFYRFLAGRFENRRLSNLRLREKGWISQTK